MEHEFLTQKGNTTIHFGNGYSCHLLHHTHLSAIQWAKEIALENGWWFTYTVY